MPIQLAFAGVAHIHTPGFIGALKKRESSLRVKSVYDPHPVKAQKRAAELGASVVADVEAIARDPEIKAVVVCSETALHERLVLPLAAAGKDLFVEKPLGIGAADARKMADAIVKAGVKFQTGYFMRGLANLITVKHLIDSGTLGKITRARGSNCHSGSLGGWFDEKPDAPESSWRWMADVKQSGVGAFGDLGTHSLDILLWLLGSVSSATATLDPGTNRYGCDETGEGLMVFKNGAIGTLAAAWVDQANPVSLLVSGTKGHAAVIDGKLHVHAPESKLSGEYTDLKPAAAAGFEAFLDALEGKPAALVTPAEAAERSAVMEALYQGAAKKTWVSV